MHQFDRAILAPCRPTATLQTLSIMSNKDITMVASRSDLLRLYEDLLVAQQLPHLPLTPADLRSIPSTFLAPGDLSFPWPNACLPYRMCLGARGNAVLGQGWTQEAYVQEDKIEETMQKVLHLNENDDFGFWKVVEWEGRRYPVYEQSLHIASSPSQALIWQFCLSLNTQFQLNILHFLPRWRQIAIKTKEMLIAQGFRNIKEAKIPQGMCYLVILKDEDMPESWDKFPMKIEITEIATFRILFSMHSSVVTVQKAFISASKQLISLLNWQLDMGFYSYSSLSQQLHLTLQLPYQRISLSDIDSALVSYYKTAIDCYRNTVKALVQLCGDTKNANESVEGVCEYLAETTVGEYMWKRLDYGTDVTGFEGDIERMRILENMQITANYCLPQPNYLPLPHISAILVKNSPLLVPIQLYLQQYPYSRSHIITQILHLIDALRGETVVPRLDMLHCSKEDKTLFIIPNKRFFGSIDGLLTEIFALFTDLWTQRNAPICAFSGYYEIDMKAFDTFSQIYIESHIAYKAQIGEKEILLHKIEDSSITPGLEELIELYRSISRSKIAFENPIIGWSRGQICAISSENEGNCWYICEDYKAKACNLDLTWLDIVTIIDILLDMHANGLVHWFVSPFTLRRSANSPSISLIFPSLVPALAHLVFAMLPSDFQPFLAPEVREFLQEGVAVECGWQSDVYSVCKLISECKGKEVRHLSLLIGGGLEAGLCPHPGRRPSLQDLRDLVHSVAEK